MLQEVQTLNVPVAQFTQHIIDLAREGEIEYQVADEIREKIGFRDVFNTGTHFNSNVTDEQVELHFETTSTVSERVARKTHTHPAEYENHDVTIHGTIIMEWSTEQLPYPQVFVEQEEHPTDHTPNIDIDAYKYDL